MEIRNIAIIAHPGTIRLRQLAGRSYGAGVNHYYGN